MNGFKVLGAVIIALFVTVSGCSGIDQYTGLTEVNYESGKGYYKSSKNQQNFKAEIKLDADGKPTQINIETTATTPESAIAAALQAQLEMQKQISDLLQVVVPMATKAAGVP